LEGLLIVVPNLAGEEAKDFIVRFLSCFRESQFNSDYIGTGTGTGTGTGAEFVTEISYTAFSSV
jgi:hypothetical protein